MVFYSSISSICGAWTNSHSTSGALGYRVIILQTPDNKHSNKYWRQIQISYQHQLHFLRSIPTLCWLKVAWRLDLTTFFRTLYSQIPGFTSGWKESIWVNHPSQGCNFEIAVGFNTACISCQQLQVQHADDSFVIFHD